MPVSVDLELTRAVRRVLVKHWIDLGRISVRCVSGRVYMNGLLQRIAGKTPALQNATVNAVFYEIKRIKGVKAVNGRLENWVNESGKWHAQDRHDLEADRD